MDPNACFKRLTDALEDQDWDEAFSAIEDLWQWMWGGGFPPKIPDNTWISLGNGGRDSYSIVCGRNVPACIWKYTLDVKTGRQSGCDIALTVQG